MMGGVSMSHSGRGGTMIPSPRLGGSAVIPAPRPELRATIIARDRIARELRVCDERIAQAMRNGRPGVRDVWLRRRREAWDALAALNEQQEALTR